MLALLVLSLLRVDPAAADSHLMKGAQLFRTEHFPEALVEFQVARTLGAEDAGWYEASALLKLNRPEEALEAFDRADALAPESRDALLDYYRGVACYKARLYACADGLFASAADKAGPKITALVKDLRERIGRVLAAEPPTSAVDFYLDQAQAYRAQGRLALAVLNAQEALALAKRRKDQYRSEDAASELEQARSQKDAALPNP